MELSVSVHSCAGLSILPVKKSNLRAKKNIEGNIKTTFLSISQFISLASPIRWNSQINSMSMISKSFSTIKKPDFWKKMKVGFSRISNYRDFDSFDSSIVQSLRCEIFGFFLLSFPQNERKCISFAQFVYFLREVWLLFNLWIIKFSDTIEK